MYSRIFDFMSEHPVATVFITWAICDVPIKLTRILLLKNNIEIIDELNSIKEHLKDLDRKVKILECIINKKLN
jgi:hypothetical protein